MSDGYEYDDNDDDDGDDDDDDGDGDDVFILFCIRPAAIAALKRAFA